MKPSSRQGSWRRGRLLGPNSPPSCFCVRVVLMLPGGSIEGSTPFGYSSNHRVSTNIGADDSASCAHRPVSGEDR